MRLPRVSSFAGRRTSLLPGRRLLLRDVEAQLLPHGFDVEGLVVQGHQAWIASEGRRTLDRRACLLRIDLSSGRQLNELALPAAWLERPGQGLRPNKGPESLTAFGPDALMLAAEAPLLQNGSGGGAALARLTADQSLSAAGALDVGPFGSHDGLTDLRQRALPPNRLFVRNYWRSASRPTIGSHWPWVPAYWMDD